MKQTAIDFLESEFNKWAEGRLFIPQHIIEQAKEMEKKYIIKAHKEGCYLAQQYERINIDIASKDYYNETFKSE